MTNRTSRNARAMFMIMMLLLAVASVVAAGCNTVRGFGEDFSAAGQGLADMAQDASK